MVSKKEKTKKPENLKKSAFTSNNFFDELSSSQSLYFMAGILIFSLLMVFRDFIFGNSLFLFKDIASDTINIFYPQLLHVADYLASEGIPKWSFKQGMGQNILPLSIGDPFNWILYLFGKEKLAFAIAWVELLKLFSAGMLFYCFLRSVKMSPLASIIGGLSYAFSGFMIVGASWYIFTTQGVYIALMLWGFERLYQHKSWWMLTLSLFLISFNMPFHLYLAGVILLFYSSLRFFESNDGKYHLKKLGKLYLVMLGCGLLAVMMSTVMFISTIEQVLNSPRVAGESSFFSKLMSNDPYALADARQLLTGIGRLFSSDFFFGPQYEILNNNKVLAYKGWNNYLEAPAFYCGLANLILLPQLMLHLNKRKKIVYSVGILLALTPFLFPFLRNTFWLFSGDYYRIYSLVVILSFLLWSIKSLHLILKEKSVNFTVLAISVVLVLALMYLPFSNTSTLAVDEQLRNVLFFFLVAEAIAIAGLNFKRYQNISCLILLALVASEFIYSGSNTYNSDRQTIKKTDFAKVLGYNDETINALAFLKETDPTPFYRIEKVDFSSGVAMHRSINEAKAQGYNSTPSYHSFNQKNYIQFLTDLDIINPKDENQTRWAPGLTNRPLLQLIASTKYALIKNPKTNRIFFQDYRKVGEITILSNPLFIPFGFTYDRLLDHESFLKLTDNTGVSLKKQIALLKAMTISKEDFAAFSALSTYNPQRIKVDYLPAALETDVNNRRAETLQISSFSSNQIKGTISTSAPKALFFSIPFDPSWKIKVNGKYERLYLANSGFMAVPLKAGNHTIELEFTPPYWEISIVLSVVGFLIFGGLLWWKSRSEKIALEK